MMMRVGEGQRTGVEEGGLFEAGKERSVSSHQHCVNQQYLHPYINACILSPKWQELKRKPEVRLHAIAAHGSGGNASVKGTGRVKVAGGMP